MTMTTTPGPGAAMVLDALGLADDATPGDAVRAIRRLSQRVITSEQRYSQALSSWETAERQRLALADAIVDLANELLDSHGVNLLDDKALHDALAPLHGRYLRR